jgi:ADP-dependent NAD(P)H-hydrate dehydratase / NAD(P)H-hydrate epimerase
MSHSLLSKNGLLVSCEEMRDAEKAAFASGHSAESLMEEAGRLMAMAIHDLVPGPGRAILYTGRGHNAGDAFVAGRYLLEKGWEVFVRAIFPEKSLSPLTRKNASLLRGSGGQLLEKPPHFPRHGPLVLLDGLLGIGGRDDLESPILEACQEINDYRNRHALVFALDIPTGLDADTGASSPMAVKADWTLTVAAAKRGLVADAAINHTGRLVVIPVPAIPLPESSPVQELCLTPQLLRDWLPRRDFDTHKGKAGRLVIWAGSPGFHGAAELVAQGALHAGAGLVTLACQEKDWPVFASRMPAEVMVKRMEKPEDLFDWQADAIVLGPGLPASSRAILRNLVKHHPSPMVIDAEAWNAVAEIPEECFPCNAERLFTPHPGEFARFPKAQDADIHTVARTGAARDWTTCHSPHALLLKGARTIVASDSYPILYNTTGNPGMATGGMGDILSGVAGAWLAQGLSSYRAAALAAWTCGRAAELAIATGSCESLTPTMVFQHLGKALTALRHEEW